MIQARRLEPAQRLTEADCEAPLAVRGLCVAYGEQLALEDVDWRVAEGRRTAIIGPNGAGKSTLLKAALDLAPPQAGAVGFWGQRFSRARKRVAFVPQRGTVDWTFPIDALGVVTMGRYSRIGWFKSINRAHRQFAEHCLERVGLADIARRQIGQLSGGQQQRVFFARALAAEPELFLMDEPFAGIDAASGELLHQLLADETSAGHTVVVVHHDLEEVRQHFDRALLIDRRVIADGPVDEVLLETTLARAYSDRTQRLLSHQGRQGPAA